MLAIPAEERSWRVLLQEGNLRPSSLCRHSMWNMSRTPYPLVKDFVLYVRIYELYGMKFLTPIIDIERRFANKSMLGAAFTIPNLTLALKLQKEAMAKRRAAATAKKRASKDALKEKSMELVNESLFDSPLETSPLRTHKRRKTAEVRALKSIDADPKGKTAVILFPSGVSAFRESSTFWASRATFFFRVIRNT